MSVALAVALFAGGGSFLGGLVGNFLRPVISREDAQRIASRAVQLHATTCPAAAPQLTLVKE